MNLLRLVLWTDTQSIQRQFHVQMKAMNLTGTEAQRLSTGASLSMLSPQLSGVTVAFACFQSQAETVRASQRTVEETG